MLPAIMGGQLKHAVDGSMYPSMRNIILGGSGYKRADMYKWTSSPTACSANGHTSSISRTRSLRFGRGWDMVLRRRSRLRS